MKRPAVVLLVIPMLIAGCASSSEIDPAVTGSAPSVEYEESTTKTASYRCPPGYVLRCESKRVGRIRFNSIGRDNLESCSCEVNAMPPNSPLPGIY